jgi:hypothetical protein
MKKFLWFLIGVIITLSPLLTHAVGSCSVATVNSTEVARVTWTCTADASDGSFPTTVTASPELRGWVYVVDATPGIVLPTEGSGFTLKSSSTSVDVLGGNASTILGAAAGRITPASSGWVNGTLTPIITGNIVHSALFTITAWVWKQLR